jgi:hypothetical protein
MTVSADTICKTGVSYPAAIEIARQINGGPSAAHLGKLVASGIAPQKATELVRQITAGVFDSHKLCLAGFSSHLADQMKRTSGL